MRFVFEHSDSLRNEILSTDKLTIELTDSEFSYMHHLGTIYVSMAEVVLPHLLTIDPDVEIWLDRGFISNRWYLRLEPGIVNPAILKLKTILAPTKDFDFLYELYKFLTATKLKDMSHD